MPTFRNFEDRIESAYHGPAGSATAEQEQIVINIPQGQTLVITAFANEVDDALAWGNVAWTIYADGVPVRNYTEIKDQYGLFNQMRPVPPGFITASRELKIVTRNDDLASTFKLGVSIQGAYFQND